MEESVENGAQLGWLIDADLHFESTAEAGCVIRLYMGETLATSAP